MIKINLAICSTDIVYVQVCFWVQRTCVSHSLPVPNMDRFLMNGKAVCLMSPAMFSSRVPLGGKTLYKDFQIRLAKALH